jgi:cullin-4
VGEANGSYFPLSYVFGSPLTRHQIEIRSIFLFLDRSYLYASPQRDTLDITGNHIFREHILESSDLSTQLLRGICALFEQDRESDGQNFLNHELLLSAMRMVSGLGLYSKKFEPLFVQTSREYYAQLTKRLSQTHSLATYIKECVSQVKKEGARCDEYHVEPSTKRQIIAVMDDEMIRNNLAHLTDKERVHDLLLRRDSNSLRALYKLLQRACNPGEELKAAWQAYIVKEGTSILEDKEKESEMVRRLLDLKGTLESMWQNPLEKNETIGFALRESFSAFINARKEGASIKENSKPAEMIAKYIDQLLRNGAKNLPPVAGVEHIKGDDDAELAYRLELVLNLFRFVQGKDVFEAFYKKDLARRLLMGRSASDDAEQLMLSKLKTGMYISATRLNGLPLTHEIRVRRRLHQQPRGHVQGHEPEQGIGGFLQRYQGRRRIRAQDGLACQHPESSGMALVPGSRRQHPPCSRTALRSVRQVLHLQAPGQETYLAPRPLALRARRRLSKG